MQSFNTNHWNHVKKVRESQGLNAKHHQERLRPDHHLANATFRALETGALWSVKSVQEDWQQGRFLTATMESEGVHLDFVIENINCCQEEILNKLGEFREGFVLALH